VFKLNMFESKRRKPEIGICVTRRHDRASAHVTGIICRGHGCVAYLRLMVYLPPPPLASASRPSYGEAYARILTAHRRLPLTSASSVIMLVAPDVDALCAARMLADLFKQDDVMHRVVPVSGIAELEKMRDELMSYAEVSYSPSVVSLHNNVLRYQTCSCTPSYC
jgi:hypothetical protein